MIKRLGICWDGTEELFEKLLLDTAKKFNDFGYLEIGICYCQTLQGAYLSLRDNHATFRMVGVDPHPDPQQDFKADLLHDRRIRILPETAHEFFQHTEEKFHFSIIDGCHSESCATDDFIGVEKLSIPGSVVLFHDFQIGCQGGDNQPHCNKPIGVRAAVEKLGLADGRRNGWKRLPDFKGDHTRNGADCGAFQMV